MYKAYAKPQISNILKSISHLNSAWQRKGCNEVEMLNINHSHTSWYRKAGDREDKGNKEIAWKEGAEIFPQ